MRFWGTTLQRRVQGGLTLVAAAAALLWPPDGSAQRYVATTDPEYPRLKYADSLTSVNDRCAVSKKKLNPKARPVYVNRQAVGFC